MTQTITGGLPIDRDTPLDPPTALINLPGNDPITRMQFPDGHLGWLVTGYSQARAVLSDPRFSSQAGRKHAPIYSEVVAERAMTEPPPGVFLELDPPGHTRYRKLLAGEFTVRRLSQLNERVIEIVEQVADQMESKGSPLDFVPNFGLPIPSLVICELLGVPYSDRQRFQQDTAQIMKLDTDREAGMAALGRLFGFLGELVQQKHKTPTDDLLSGLVNSGELTDAELAGVGAQLLTAGHDTTANMLSLGTFALMTHRDQWDRLRADPSLVEQAVEELLRYLTIVHFGTQRVPTEDVEIDGVHIAAGESVQVHLPAANRDPNRFPDPQSLDVTRERVGHLAFGHGIHQCIGQQLARLEMRAAFSTLVRRFPNLELAVPADEVLLRSDMEIYGVHQLPVKW